VFSRAIEDAIDLILMRSRGEAELARMETEIKKLKNLEEIWESSKNRRLLPCRVAHSNEETSLVLRNLHYSRGTAQARADHLTLTAGVYALTGSNGSGKFSARSSNRFRHGRDGLLTQAFTSIFQESLRYFAFL
jgi:hypothetical protein